jgi:hypothetical protein
LKAKSNYIDRNQNGTVSFKIRENDENETLKNNLKQIKEKLTKKGYKLETPVVKTQRPM